jgi:hypothetical protein
MWGMSEVVYNGATDLKVVVAAKAEPEKGKELLTVNGNESSRVYYRITDIEPTPARRVGEAINKAENGWKLMTATNQKNQEISGTDSQFVEVIELDTNDKVTRWGKSKIDDGYVAASGLSLSVDAKTPPETGKLLVKVYGWGSTNNAIRYRVTDQKPIAKRVGEVVNTSFKYGWTWIGLEELEISAANGKYIEVIQVDSNNKVLEWGEFGPVYDGNTLPSGLTVVAKAKTVPEYRKVTFSVTGRGKYNTLYYRVKKTEPVVTFTKSPSFLSIGSFSTT